jgi:YHS domain-containing protein
MIMKNMALALVLTLPLAACEKKSQTAQPQATSPQSATLTPAGVGDDPAVPKVAVGQRAKCPVSGEDFLVRDDTVQLTYNQKRYAFCCSDCAPAFQKNPQKYAKQ